MANKDELNGTNNPKPEGKGKKGGRGGKHGGKGGKGDRKPPNPEKFETGNNPEWYTRNAQVSKDAATLSYSTPLGANVLENGARLTAGQGTGIYTAQGKSLPGILRINYIPTIGISESKSSPVNLAAQQVFSWVRHANSGSRNYEFPDYMMYLLAMDSAYTFHAHLVRCYGLFSNYSYKNRYINRALIEACGFDYDDIQANLATFRTLINQFAVKLNTFAIPKEMSLFDRHAYLPLNVFADSTLDTSNLYVFVPSTIYTWDGTTDSNGTQLVNQEIPHLYMNTIQQYINNILSTLLDNEDIGMMSGDTLKAFGETGLRKLEMIPDNASIKPIYDEGMLCQIHNLTYLGPASVNPITQNTEKGIITSCEIIGSDVNTLGYIPEVTATILDSGMSSPTSDFNLEATRLKYSAKYVDAEGQPSLKVSNAGTEIVSGLKMYKLDNGMITEYEFPRLTAIPYSGKASASLVNSNLIDAILNLTTFDWAPLVNYETVYDAPDDIHAINAHIIGPIFNYTVLTDSTLFNINQAVLQSLLNVYGTYISKK